MGNGFSSSFLKEPQCLATHEAIYKRKVSSKVQDLSISRMCREREEGRVGRESQPMESQCPVLPFTRGLAVLSQLSADPWLKDPLTMENVTSI